MVLYGLGIWGQTLLALGVLGLVGGWVLWPFRRPDRPYLWLAAPLAGVITLSAALTVLYFACRLPLPICLAIAVPVFAGSTLFLVARWARQSPRLPRWPWAVAGIVAVSAWGALSSNWTAVVRAEPTVCIMDGTDTLGYVPFADWVLQHPQENPAWSPDKPAEAWIHVLNEGESRLGSFLLLAVAAYVRGSPALYSYDWASGVALTAGVLGVAGFFASGRRGLLLLLAVGVVSLWLPISRTGYFGKVLAYPGCVLLAGVFLATWARLSVGRLLLAGFLANGVALCHSPVTVMAVLSVVLGGTWLASLPVWLLWKPAPDFAPDRRLTWTHFVRGPLVCAFLVITPQIFFFIRLKGIANLGEFPKAMLGQLAECQFSPSWFWVSGVSLDLDCHAMPLVGSLGGHLSLALLWAAVLLPAVFVVLAVCQRDVAAAGCSLAVGLLGAAWWMNREWAIYQFQGLLFPVSAVGVVLAVQRLPRGNWKAGALRWAALAMGIAVVLLRVPQAEQTFQRYVCVPSDTPFCFVRSEIVALVEKIGDRTIDVTEPKPIPGLVLLTEFGRKGIRAQFSEASWATLVGYTGWKVPQYPAKGELTLCDGRGWFPPSTIRFHNRQFLMAQDRDAVTLGPVQAPTIQEVDEQGRPCFWLGHKPTEFEVWNGTGEMQPALFVGVGRPGPSNSNTTQRTVAFTLDGRRGAQVVTQAEDWKVHLPLEVPPGKSHLAVWAEDPINVVFPPPEVRELLLLISEFHLEPGPASQAGPGAASAAGASLDTKE